ncbi:hypothetical protein PR048_013033 [Dryococelus australis]|uniref:HTH psq-type domain-containing protein n=1 Tax=Dryococelus australis TaxID=614101 RepID=A0ABQ9HRV8_9NEOP|nr:hypothetical protein PR048_013033 [Dryococelus australis]
MFALSVQMPKQWVRTTTRGIYTAEQISSAIHALESGTTIRQAGREFSIAEATIRLRMKTGSTEPTVLRRKSTFSRQQEGELSDHVLEVANLFYGMTPVE